MKILHITRSLIKTSGVSVFVAESASAQAELGHDVSLVIRWNPFYEISPKIRFRVDRSLWRTLRQIERPDVVHIHGLWFEYSIAAMLWCWWHKVPFIVSPHGSLMPRVFQHGQLKKCLAYTLLLKPLIGRATAIHCTGEAESEVVAALGFKQRRYIVPLGCHLPPWPVNRIKCGKRKVLFLSRISEEKGLSYLLDAWKGIKQPNNQQFQTAQRYSLVLAGPDWRGYQSVLKLKIDAEAIPDVAFVGNADEMMKDELYRSADLFVLPSPMENFSMVVLDALAYGVPTICTKGTPWRVIEDRRCGWWVDPNSVPALEKALLQAMGTPAERYEQMRARAYEVAKEFSWSGVAEKLVSGYVSEPL